MNEDKLWYNWRRVYSDKGGYERRVSLATMEEYKKAALFCVKSPRGPCSYEGYVYTGPLHLPFRPWRRVIFDEIQDLVAEGTESQKNLLQLSRTAKNVWLLSATPFPHGNMSVYANHELLGFCRLKMDVEVDYELSSSHPFEIIKRKLYIRSPKHVADEAVVASQLVTNDTVHVDATDLERKFFELEQNELISRDVFGEEYNSLRQMINHPEASKKLREQINGKDDDYRGGKKGKAVQQMNRAVGRFATVNSFAKRSLDTARARYRELEMTDIPNAQKDIDLVRSSWYLALKIRQVRSSAIQANPFASRDESPPLCLEVEEEKEIHRYFCKCPSYESSSCEADQKTSFQTMGRLNTPPTSIKGYKACQRVIDYFKNEVKPGRKVLYQVNSREEEDYLECFIRRKESVYKSCLTNKEKLESEKVVLQTRIEALEEAVKVGNTTKGMSEEEELAARNGSKTAALIQFLEKAQQRGEKTLVFSYWHDVLAFVQRSLRNNGLSSAYCNGRTGNQMAKTILSFTSGEVPILLLSAQVKASGANLQVATNVVLLDPAGSSAEHGATLEQQAIGRAVRMGQENAVKVVRFCVKDTIEPQLYNSIDLAGAKLVTRNNDNSYMCENAHKSLDEKVFKKKKEDVDDDVCIGESISAKERVARAKAQAMAKGEIIVIDDDSDDEEEDRKPKALPTMPLKAPTSNAPAKVKAEPSANGATAKRTNEEVDETEAAEGPEKRARVDRVSTESAVPATVPSSDAVMQNAAPTLSNEDNRSSAVSSSTIADSDSVSALKNVWAVAEEEYMKACNVEGVGGHDRNWLDMLIQLRAVKEKSGHAWVPGEHCRLGKWCKYQRGLKRKNSKGEKTTLTEGRIKLLDDIGFPWVHTNPTPKKTIIPPAGVQSVHNMLVESRVVSPAEAAESTSTQVSENAQLDHVVAAEENSLRDLLIKCDLERYLPKFVASGISSAGQLREKLHDEKFMEQFVKDAGLSAPQSIRLQIRASKQ